MKKNDFKQEKELTKLRHFLYVIAWIVILPVVIGLPAAMAIGGIIGSTATSVANDATSNRILFYIELSLFLSVSALVILLYLIKWYLRTRKRLFDHIGAKVLGVYIWVGIFITASFMVVATDNPGIAKPPVSRDKSLVAVLQAVGGNESLIDDVSIKYVKNYENKDQQGEYQPTLDNNGVFSYGTITIKQGLKPGDEKTTVAHEYLHHIWQTKLDIQTQHDLTSQLMTLYGNDSWMKGRTNFYSDTNMLEPTELFSFYCTEVSDQYLSKYILKQCNKYINRSVLSFMRN